MGWEQCCEAALKRWLAYTHLVSFSCLSPVLLPEAQVLPSLTMTMKALGMWSSELEGALWSGGTSSLWHKK